jgi:nucleoid-associated protein YgaU
VDVGDLEEFLRPAAPAREAPRCYVVRRGDNLTDIARRLLRDDSPAAVQKLYGANRDRLQSPHQLPVGLELAVPS